MRWSDRRSGRGAVVVCDRYVDSMLAYQGAGRVLALAEVEQVARWATEDLRPHLTVLLDLDPERAVHDQGRQGPAGGGRRRVPQRARQFFLELAAREPEHYLVLDARAYSGRDRRRGRALERRRRRLLSGRSGHSRGMTTEATDDGGDRPASGRS